MVKASVVAKIGGAAAAGALFVLACWFVFSSLSLPAYGPSYLTGALATAGVVLTLVVTAILCGVYPYMSLEGTARPDEAKKESELSIDDLLKIRAARIAINGGMTVKRTVTGAVVRIPFIRQITHLVGTLAPAALVACTLALPLGPTRLYLDGVSVDQQFRTQILTHFADTAKLTDANYLDLPAFYPSMWFWFGGRFANLMGMPGWEAFQPFALITLGAAASMLVPVWNRLLSDWPRITHTFPLAVAIAIVTTIVMLTSTAEEPYAAIVAMGAPAACAMTLRALEGRWSSIIGLGVYMGFTASMYTLYTATMSLVIAIIAFVAVVNMGLKMRSVLGVVYAGVIAVLIAAVWWLPYLSALAGGAPHSGATSLHYLNYSGSMIPLPFFNLSTLGFLCFVGLVGCWGYRFHRAIFPLGAGVIGLYAWAVLSMLVTSTGTTLLGFRIAPMVTMMLATAGVLTFITLFDRGISHYFPRHYRSYTRAVATLGIVVMTVAALGYAQSVPAKNAHAIDLAYSDTDGYGERADRYPAGSASYFAEIDQLIQSHGFVPGSTTVLTDELDFLAFYPYRGWQAMTSHYANPLGQFDLRNDAIEHWSTHGFGETEWGTPDVLVLRGGPEDSSYTYDLAEDIYPNDPNVRFRGISLTLPESYSREYVGPFVVLIKK